MNGSDKLPSHWSADAKARVLAAIVGGLMGVAGTVVAQLIQSNPPTSSSDDKKLEYLPLCERRLAPTDIEREIAMYFEQKGLREILEEEFEESLDQALSDINNEKEAERLKKYSLLRK